MLRTNIGIAPRASPAVARSWQLGRAALSAGKDQFLSSFRGCSETGVIGERILDKSSSRSDSLTASPTTSGCISSTSVGTSPRKRSTTRSSSWRPPVASTPALSVPSTRVLRRSAPPVLGAMAPGNPSLRAKLISQHLSPGGFPPSTLASSSPSSTSQSRPISSSSPAKMSSQPPHAALLIPGPIEFDDAVLQSMSHFSESHVSPGFVNTFGETISMVRKVFQTTSPTAQPFIISGSGTLGWDLVSANLVEPGENVLLLSTGYFSDGFADCLKVYGANVDVLKAPVGSRPQLSEIEAALKSKKYKMITVTHIDTSTGVLSELKDLTAKVKSVSPDTLVIVDGVCSVACEEIAFDDWKLDGVVTASQKAIGCPAGLSLSMFSGKAMEAFQARKTPPASYFASMKNWTPIMQSYEAKKPAYFATPSPQLIHALHTALSQILSRPLAERFARHKEVSDKIKKAVADMGLQQVAADPENQAHAMTAVYLPENLKPTDILPKLLSSGVIFAAGIHKEIATRYIRFGHMGVSAMDPSRTELDTAMNALKNGLAECGFKA